MFICHRCPVPEGRATGQAGRELGALLSGKLCVCLGVPMFCPGTQGLGAVGEMLGLKDLKSLCLELPHPLLQLEFCEASTAQTSG